MSLLLVILAQVEVVQEQNVAEMGSKSKLVPPSRLLESNECFYLVGILAADAAIVG